MDAWSALASLAPQLGAAGVLVIVIVVLLRVLVTTRAYYAGQLTEAEERHDRELAQCQGSLEASRTRADELHTMLDEERTRRRAAEDRGGPA